MDLKALVAALLSVLSILVFIKLASEVGEGDLESLDRRILLLFREPDQPGSAIGPRWMTESIRDLTALGSTFVLTLVTLIVIGFLATKRRYHELLLVACSVAGGTVLSYLLKSIFDRPRPDASLHLTVVETASFPSGHAMVSAVVYLTLGALLARLVGDLKLKLYCLSVAMTLTILIGLSRIYLGVHYPTDVLAGWTAGLAWALLCWAVARYLQRRGSVTTRIES